MSSINSQVNMLCRPLGRSVETAIAIRLSHLLKANHLKKKSRKIRRKDMWSGYISVRPVKNAVKFAFLKELIITLRRLIKINRQMMSLFRSQNVQGPVFGVILSRKKSTVILRS